MDFFCIVILKQESKCEQDYYTYLLYFLGLINKRQYTSNSLRTAAIILVIYSVCLVAFDWITLWPLYLFAIDPQSILAVDYIKLRTLGRVQVRVIYVMSIGVKAFYEYIQAYLSVCAFDVCPCILLSTYRLQFVTYFDVIWFTSAQERNLLKLHAFEKVIIWNKL